MFNDISHFKDRTGFILPEAVDDILPVLLGKRADYKLQSKWNFVEHIFNVYMKNMTIKDGLLYTYKVFSPSVTLNHIKFE